MLFVSLFLTLLLGATLAGWLPPVLLAFYLGASALAFCAYGVDKRAARRGEWRIRESTLHMLGLCGGWPGALLAQRAFRHKTAKRSFRVAFKATAALNCAALLAYAATGAPPV